MARNYGREYEWARGKYRQIKFSVPHDVAEAYDRRLKSLDLKPIEWFKIAVDSGMGPDAGTGGAVAGTSGMGDAATSGMGDAGTSGAVAGTSGAVAGTSGAVAGTSGVVAGTSGMGDAGTSGVVDAGTSGVVDAGTSGVVDAGTSGVVDAGTSGVVDAGTSGAADAGTSGAADAGTSAVDVIRDLEERLATALKMGDIQDSQALAAFKRDIHDAFKLDYADLLASMGKACSDDLFGVYRSMLFRFFKRLARLGVGFGDEGGGPCAAAGDAPAAVVPPKRKANMPSPAPLLVEEWCSLYRQGLSFKQIAEGSGYDVSTIRKRVRKHGEENKAD